MKFTDQELKSLHKLVDSIKVKDAIAIPKSSYSSYGIPQNAAQAFSGVNEFSGGIYYQLDGKFYRIRKSNGQATEIDEKNYWYAKSNGRKWTKDNASEIAEHVEDSVKISDDLQSEIIKHLQNAMVYAKNEYWGSLARELYELDKLVTEANSPR